MGADSTAVVYGLRYHLVDDDDQMADEDIEPYELGTDPRMVRARQVGLDHWWGRDHDGGGYYLLIGRVLAFLGAEHTLHLRLAGATLEECRREVRRLLAAADLDGEPALHLQVALR